jgi:hypothetical protein
MAGVQRDMRWMARGGTLEAERWMREPELRAAFRLERSCMGVVGGLIAGKV